MNKAAFVIALFAPGRWIIGLLAGSMIGYFPYTLFGETVGIVVAVAAAALIVVAVAAADASD